MHPSQERSPRPGHLTASRLSPISIDDADLLDEEDALWETLPETPPLDPKIMALAETLYEEEFPEN